MSMTKMTCMAGCALLAMAASAPGGAQESAGGEEAALLAQAYGPDDQIVVIGPYAFTPRHPSPAPAHLSCDFQSSDFCINAANNSDPVLYAPLELPAGALITFLACLVKDDSPSLDVSVGLLSRTFPTGKAVIAEGETSGSPGPNYITDGGFAHTVRYLTEDERPRTYQVSLVLRDDPDLAFWGCRVHWKRQLSPAPSTATFADVPTNHLFFASVEALAASGITAGCEGENFCPNEPLTRGQMAAFLAKALGLHWPW